MPDIQITRVRFSLPELTPRDAEKIRGHLGNRFSEHHLLHNHLEDGGFRYAYPLVQYKVVRGQSLILGIGIGGDVLTDIFLKLQEVVLEDRRIPLLEKEISQKVEPFGWVEEPQTYRFVTPWMGLNQKNHGVWCGLRGEEQQAFLARIFTGNLMSMSKGLDYMLGREERIESGVRLQPQRVNFKGREMMAFRGEVVTTYLVPDGFGLGKSSARGFGTLRPLAAAEAPL